MKKVLIITYYWPPSGGAGVQRWVKFAKYLAKMQVDTFVLTVDPEYATYPQIDKSLEKDIPDGVKVFHTKSFELYSLYKKVSSNKEVPYGGFSNTSKLDIKEKILRFIRGNFFLPDPRRGWNRFAYKEACNIIEEYKIDTVITTSPPHSTQLIGLKLKNKMRIKWIADFRDPWTDIYYYKKLYPTSIATFINKKLEKKVFLKADEIVTVSENIKSLFSSKLSNINDKIKIIPNGFDYDDLNNNPSEKRQDDFFYISYVGTISNEYKIDGFIDAITQLSPELKSKIKIRFIGKITNDFIELMSANGMGEMLEVVGYVPHAVAIQYMFSSDLLLLVIPKIENNKGILTGKLFEYIACKVPVLLLGPVDGDAASIIKEAKSGVVCDYDDSKQISKKIAYFFKLRQNPSVRVNTPEIEKYSRETLAKEVLKLI